MTAQSECPHCRDKDAKIQQLQREVDFIDELRNHFCDQNPEGKTIVDFLVCWEQQATDRARKAESRIRELELELEMTEDKLRQMKLERDIRSGGFEIW